MIPQRNISLLSMRFRKLWKTRLGSQMADLPHFEEVYRSVVRSMRTAGFMDR